MNARRPRVLPCLGDEPREGEPGKSRSLRKELAEQGAVVLHLQTRPQAALQPAVEIHRVRVEVVQQGALGSQPQGHRQAAAQRLDQSPVTVRLVERPRALVAELRAYMGRLEVIRGYGTVEEQKTFLRGFIERIEVNPKEGDALVFWKTIPAPPAARTNGAGMSFTVVAGAGYSAEKTSAGEPERLPLPGRKVA